MTGFSWFLATRQRTGMSDCFVGLRLFQIRIGGLRAEKPQTYKAGLRYAVE